MMRDESDEHESFDAGLLDMEAQHFNTKIENDLGYEIEDPNLREVVSQVVYNPKVKAEFGFDPVVARNATGTASVKEVVTPKPAPYAENKTSAVVTPQPAPLAENKPAPPPSNQAGQTRGFVMPSQVTPNEVEDDDDEVDQQDMGYSIPHNESKDSEEDAAYKPYSPLSSVPEANSDLLSDSNHSYASSGPRSSSDYGGYTDADIKADRVRVAVRLRPLQEDEMVSKKKKGKKGESKEDYMAWTVDVDDDVDYMMEKRARTKKEGHTIFHLDRVYEETDYTEALYTDMVSPIIKGALSGRHGTVFAFGPTGTGKSYTIQGGSGQHGMIQMACKELFDKIGRDTNREYTVRAGYFEIYNEQIRDLMGQDEAEANKGPKSRRATACVTTVNKTNVELPILTAREDPKSGEVYVDADFQKVSNVENVIRLLHKGNRNRATEKTEQNQFSSRSHAIFRILVESHEVLDNDTDTMDDGIFVRSAAVNFVDLAGSENSLKAATKGSRKAETGKINQSLLALSQVIYSLSLPPKRQPKYINYRDSQLTRILKPHLSGNAVMSIVCCASPSKKYLEETRATLKFARNAKRIKMKPQINEIVDDRALIETLKKDLHEARMRIYDLERRLKNSGPKVPEGHVVVPKSAVGSGGSNTGLCRKCGGSTAGGGGDDRKGEYPMLERFMAQMNQSVATDAFFDADDEIHSDLQDEPNPAEDDAGSSGGKDRETTEEDEAEIERIRQEVLAKFMNDFNEDDFPDESEANGTVSEAADQTMVETRDTSVQRVFTDETIETQEPKEPKKEAALEKEAGPKGNEMVQQTEKEAPAPTTAPAPADEKKGSVFRNKPEEAKEADARVEVEFQEEPKPHKGDQAAKKSFLDDDSSDMMQEQPHENDLDLIEKFRQEILEKFRDEIVDEEAAHELDENAQNVAVIANELINKFKKEIVYKYKDEFPEILVKRATDIAAARVGDSGIVGRVIERDINATTTDEDSDSDEDDNENGEPEQFEDEFEEDVKFQSKGPQARGKTPNRSPSQQTDRAMINGKPAKEHGTETPIHSSLGRGTSGSVSSDLSSDVANNRGGSSGSPVAAAPPGDDYEGQQIPFGEIAISKDHQLGEMDDKMKVKFLQEKLAATDEVVETLFSELDNAKAFIRELVFENAGSGNQGGSSLFGPSGTSGVTVVDEVILKQCEILKFAIYVSLLFFVFGQHELFLSTVFFLWLSLEVATKA